jgi:hypothetical protein
MRSTLDAAYVRDQYEVMRREALDGDRCGSRGHGLALLLSRGMPAWLAALSILDRHPTFDNAAEDVQLTRSPELAPAVRSELASVWASMVFACSQETAR